MSASVTHHRSWKQMWRTWGFLIFLCLLGVIAALGAWAILTSLGTAKHARYGPVEGVSVSVSLEQVREWRGLERLDRMTLGNGK